MFNTEDTIVAISTAAGRGNRAIVRLSGPSAVELGETVFCSSRPSLAELGGFRAVSGLVHIADQALESPARAYRFRAPFSYTREDLIEIHLPGNTTVSGTVLDALISSGARLAEAGEFTARAFISGRIDLSQAEAVADIIAASDDAQLRASLGALGGEVHKLCSAAAEELADALATVEASIDLAEEKIELDSPQRLAEKLHSQAENLGTVAKTATDLPDTTELPQVVIAGRPNVGKSSLLNALAGTDRAITSALAGTTRDVLSASTTLPCGAKINLLDVAGFAPAEDSLALAADQAAKNAVARADMILFVIDARTGCEAPDQTLLDHVQAVNPTAPILQLENKIDLTKTAERSHAIFTSAATGEGLQQVRQKLTETLHLSTTRPGSALGLHDRQRRCLQISAQATHRAAELLEEVNEIADVAELAAVELRQALAQLGAISGEIVTDDILGRIFARFCVGK